MEIGLVRLYHRRLLSPNAQHDMMPLLAAGMDTCSSQLNSSLK
jgi:hypothetical protein